MFDLAILHLSDLHIGGEGKSISKPLNSLLADIKTQVQSIPDKKLVIAVTGDTINIGDYRALESAKTFFRKLKDIVGNRVCALYIVPGNHDKTRTPENEFLVTACRKLSDEQLSKKEIDKKDHFDQTFEKTVSITLKAPIYLLSKALGSDTSYSYPNAIILLLPKHYILVIDRNIDSPNCHS